MAFIIPWIFKAGTKAKAAEVNENFRAVKQFVDLLEEDVAANQIMVQTLDDTKANINGNALERFQVATAIVGNDAVNLNTLKKNTQNARGYIDGFKLSATTKVVTASAGNCYSYDPNTKTYEYLINSSTALQTETLTLGANAKYYVFVCGDSSGAKYPKLSVTVNTTTPSLPAGLDCWRRLGNFTTDKNGNIDEIYNEGDQVIPKRVGFIGSKLSTIVAFANSEKEYTASRDLWLYVLARPWHSDLYIYVKVSETWVQVGRAYYYGDGAGDNGASSVLIPIKKNQEYKIKAVNGTDWDAYTFAME